MRIATLRFRLYEYFSQPVHTSVIYCTLYFRVKRVYLRHNLDRLVETGVQQTVLALGPGPQGAATHLVIQNGSVTPTVRNVFYSITSATM